MNGMLDRLKRFAKFNFILIPLILTLVGGYRSPAHANTCKSWVTVSDECSTECAQHGAVCDIYECYCTSSVNSSSGNQEIWCSYPGWNPAPVRNGETCGLCTKATQELQCNTCANPNKITSFSASPTIIKSGETTIVSWSASGCIQTATLTVGGKTFNFQDVSSGSAAWTGTNDDDNTNDPKTYDATITASGDCCGSDTQTIQIKVLPQPKMCPLPFNSSVKAATGSLLQSESLFSTKGTGLATDINLTYDSLDPRNGPLGVKWSHNYDISLTLNADSSMILREGNTRSIYDLVNGVYVAETGDFSTLVKNADNTYTITYTDGTKTSFNAAGQIMAKSERSGNSLSFAYDASGNLSAVIDAATRSTTFGYDSNRISRITDPAGKFYDFGYTGNILTSVTWPDGSHWNYTNDDTGHMLTKTDPLGKVTTYTYDAHHRVLTGTDSSGTKTVAYPTATNTVKSSTMTEKDGGLWTYTYDSHNGYLTQKSDPLGNTTTYTHDANRNLTRETAPDSSSTHYTYDTAGNRLSMTDAMGNTTTYVYNGLGQVTSTTDPIGRISTNTYDDQGNLIQTIGPRGEKSSYLYDAKGNMTSVTNALNQTSTFTYDGANNQITSTDPAGAVTTFTYDAMGNMLTQTDARGKVTTYEYDGRYRLAKITDPLGNITSHTYNYKGNKTSQTDGNGNVTRYEYDDQGHLVKTTDSAGFATTYTYAATGCPSCGGGTDKITSLTDAKGQTTGYQYDPLGRLVQETDPLNKVTSYAYDEVGNLVSKLAATGIVTNYYYDPLKRLVRKDYSNIPIASFSYDAVGRLMTASNSDITYSYTYDTADRVTSVTDSVNTINYEYDNLGNRTKMIVWPDTPNQRVSTYAYDNNGRVTGITSNTGTFTYGYDSLGRRTSLSYPNQVNAAYAYDDIGRLTSLTHASDTTTIAFANYTDFDKVGNRKAKTSTVSGPEQYLYDLVYRVMTVTNSVRPEIFAYDAVGNRTLGPGQKDTAYQYDADNRVTQGRKLQYLYDGVGNQVLKTVPNAADKEWLQTWDAENRLVQVYKAKGTERKTVSFKYDPYGRRIEKRLTTQIDGVTKESIWYIVYDNDNIAVETYIEEYGIPAVTTFYTHGVGVDEHLALERDIENSSAQFYYYHADGLGSVVSITDASRNVVQSYDYDSFGMVKPATAFVNSYTYTGREWDKETGLYYYRARYYDPMEGRFLQKDPISFNGGDANLYAMVQNNPINFIDPSGLFGIGGGFGVTLGVVSVSTSINYKECCSNGKRHKRTVRTWCLGYELGLSLKGTGGSKGSSDNSAIQACPASTTYTYENGTQVWGALVFGTSYSGDSNSNSMVTGLGGGISFYEQCTDTVIADVVTDGCCN